MIDLTSGPPSDSEGDGSALFPGPSHEDLVSVPWNMSKTPLMGLVFSDFMGSPAQGTTEIGAVFCDQIGIWF